MRMLRLYCTSLFKAESRGQTEQDVWPGLCRSRMRSQALVPPYVSRPRPTYSREGDRLGMGLILICAWRAPASSSQERQGSLWPMLHQGGTNGICLLESFSGFLSSSASLGLPISRPLALCGHFPKLEALDIQP